MSAELLGPIVGLFVQRQPVKRGKVPLREYCTDDLLPVAAITVDRSGVIGETAAGESVLDVRHRNHPASRDRKGWPGCRSWPPATTSGYGNGTVRISSTDPPAARC